eukprot:1118715-Pelagomonas_calceolata.AAC.2
MNATTAHAMAQQKPYVTPLCGQWWQNDRRKHVSRVKKGGQARGGCRWQQRHDAPTRADSVKHHAHALISITSWGLLPGMPSRFSHCRINRSEQLQNQPLHWASCHAWLNQSLQTQSI